MEILDEKKLEIAETYAVDLVKLKLSKSIFSLCLISALLLGIGASFIVPWSSMFVSIIAPIAFSLPFALVIASLIAKKSERKIYSSIAAQCNVSKKELKEFIKSEEMKTYLEYIFSDKYKSASNEYNPRVEQIAKLSDTLNGRNPDYISPMPIIESIRKDIYGKKGSKKKNSRKQ